MKAERTVKRITFDPNEAKPGEILFISVPKLNEHEVIVPGSLSLVFDIDLSGGHENNFLVQNVSRALVDKRERAPLSKTLLDTTFTRSLRICFSQWMRAKTRCWRVFKARICARSARAPVIKSLQA